MDDPDGANAVGIVASTGLFIAPFDLGAAIYDPVTQRVQVLGPLGAWLVAQRTPRAFDELLDELVAQTNGDRGPLEHRLHEAVNVLTAQGLLGRREPIEPLSAPPAAIGSLEEGWSRGSTHGFPGGTYAFCGPQRAWINAVDDLLGTPLEHLEPDVLFGLVPGDDGGIDVIIDEAWHFDDLDRLCWQLPSILNDTVSHSDAMIVLHAGAIRTPSGRLVVVTGPVNTGKSTMVAALVTAGCDYLGDESIGFESTTMNTWAYPKPLTLDPISQQIVGLDPVGASNTSGEHRLANELRAGTVCLTGQLAAPDVIMHIAYRADAQTYRRRLDSHRALGALLTNALNLGYAGPDGFDTLCAMAETVPVVSIVHDDTRAMADLIVSLDADPQLMVEPSKAERGGDDPGVEPGHWWFDWYGVAVQTTFELATFTVDAEILVVAPELETRVVDEVAAMVISGARDRLPVARIVERLGTERADDQLDARRLDVVNAVRRLAASGFIEVDRYPRVELPEPSHFDDELVSRRTLSGNPEAIVRPGTLTASMRADRRLALAPQPGEQYIGDLRFDDAGQSITVRISTNVPAMTSLVGPDHETTVTPAAHSATDPGPDPLRIVSLPHTTPTQVLIIHPRIASGPVDETRIEPALLSALGVVTGIGPPDGYRLRSVWAMDSAGGKQLLCEGPDTPELPPQARFVPEQWLSADGAHLWELDWPGPILQSGSPRWRKIPLEEIVVASDARSKSEVLAVFLDRLRIESITELEPAVQLVKTFGSTGRLRCVAPTNPNPGTGPAPRSVTAFDAFGARRDHSHSITLNGAGQITTRSMWFLQQPDSSSLDEQRSFGACLAAFAVGSDIARALDDPDLHLRALLIGVDRDDLGATIGHTVVFDVSDPATWKALSEAILSIDPGGFASLATPDDHNTEPATLTWTRELKTRNSTWQLARRAHPTTSVGAAINEALAGQPTWLAPVLDLVGLDRNLEDPLHDWDFDVVGPLTPRRIDVDLDDHRVRGDRRAGAHWLAALAGLDPQKASSWVEQVIHRGHARVQAGIDGHGRPAITLIHYLD